MSDVKHANGEFRCPVAKDWDEYLSRQKEVFRQVNEVHRIANSFSQHIRHLEHLDALPDIRDKLLDSATGRKQIDRETFLLIMKIGACVVFALVFCIVFLITGESTGLFSLLGHK